MHTSQISLLQPTLQSARTNIRYRESLHWETPPHKHTQGFHIYLLSLLPSLNFYLLCTCQGHPHLQAIATVTLCDITAWWKNVCVCLLNTEARDVTPFASDHDCSCAKETLARVKSSLQNEFLTIGLMSLLNLKTSSKQTNKQQTTNQ